MKRLIDIALSVVGIITFLPVFLLIPILIRLDDGGPVFFRQARLGQFKRPFRIYKFRSMRDGRVTRIGRWLRRSGLDEIPQFLNIYKGEMSVVGPRPLTLADVQRLGWDTRYYIARWQIKPGLTGLSQLYAGRSAHHSWFYDKAYLKNPHLWLDLQIILLSFAMNVLGKRRVRNWLYARNKLSVNWHRWAILFAARRDRALPEDLNDCSHYPWAAALARSLAIFQLGESGGGTIVQQVQHSRLRGVDRAYCQSILWFVDEEHRHAEMLARCVQALGGQCIEQNWTAHLFVAGRRLMGIRLKLLVLLAAEVVGLCYYKLLAMRLPPGQIRNSLDELALDEEAHLKFHSEFLRIHVHGWLRTILFKLAWRFVTYCAAIVVSIDHYRALKAMHIPIKLVWRRWMYLVRETESQVIAIQPDYHFLRHVNLYYGIKFNES